MNEAAQLAGHGSQITLEDTDLSLPEFFEQRAAVYYSRIAIGCGTWQPTYAELNHAANHLAHVLLSRGGRPGERVIILMQQDHGAAVAAILAVLKARLVFVVLDPSHPPARLEQMVASAEPVLALADTFHLDRATQLCGKESEVVCFEDHFATTPSPDPGIYAAPDELAFLTYTSGSTGRPKGVMGTHRTVLHHVYRCSFGMRIHPGDRVAPLSSLSGGQGLGMVWCALSHGAGLFPFPVSAGGLTGLSSWLVTHKITFLASATSVFRHLVHTAPADHGYPDVRLVRIGSEATTSEDWRAFRKCFSDRCVLMHAYSTSESGNISQKNMGWNDEVREGLLPAGRPIAGMEVVIVDEGGRELPQGETAFIELRSRYLSPGYWRDPEQTSASFSDRGADGIRRYRTGDQGWLNPERELVVTGRKVGQVNVYGHNVDLSEIETALLRQNGVASAVVLAREPKAEGAKIVAFVAPRTFSEITRAGLLEALRSFLPPHMVPGQMVIMAALPLTTTGKPDRQKLQERLNHDGMLASSSGPDGTPASETEELLAATWAGVLNRESVNRDEDFFEMGGDSLRAAAIAVKLQKILGVELDLRAFASHPTVAMMGRKVDALRLASPSAGRQPMVRVPREGLLQASFVQERIWRYSQTPEGAAGYTRISFDRILGPLDITALRRSLDELVRRHEILRCGFVETGGHLVQIIHPPEPVGLEVKDWRDVADTQEAAAAEKERELQHPFEVVTGPLFRFKLMSVRQEEHWLMRTGHYMIVDGSSWRILFTEMMRLYEAHRNGGMTPSSSGPSLQYGDFAAWQRERFRPGSPGYADEMAWWRQQVEDFPAKQSIPFRRPEPLADAPVAESKIAWNLDTGVSRHLDELGRKSGATYYSTRLALFSASLALQTGQSDVTLGTYATNRLLPEVQDMPGCFLNLTTLFLSCQGHLGFRQWLTEVSRVVMDSQMHSGMPYELLREELGKEQIVLPEIHMIFGISDQKPPLRAAGLEITSLPLVSRRAESMPWGFTMSLEPMNETHPWLTSFDARIYDPAAVRAHIEWLKRLAHAVCHEPDQPLAELMKTVGNDHP